MKAAIGNFANTEGENKILVLGAMAELGKSSINEHLNIVEEIKRHNWKDVVLVGGDFLKIDHPYQKFASSTDAGNWLKNQKPENAYLLIKGSRSMQMEKVLEFI